MKLVLSAGETSGDQIAADLARALIERHPGVQLAGLAGPRMQAAGVEPWFDMDQLNVMGLSEIIRHLPRLIRLRREFKQRIKDWRADAFIGIDAPDFNLGLARQLKGELAAVHYVSPSVWAWRAGRIPKIASSLDLLLTLYPFEPELYAPYGLKAKFVGHHIADELAREPDRDSARIHLGLNDSLHGNQPVIALLPGSRSGELRRHAELVAQTSIQLRQRYPNAQLLILLARESDRTRLKEIAGRDLEHSGLRWVIGDTRAGLRAADVALAASGTVTLEAFLLGCPLVVFYRVSSTTYWTARTLRLIKSQHVSLPNILTRQALVPECLQQHATADQLVRQTAGWLESSQRVRGYRQIAREWEERLATDAGQQAAAAILDHLGT